MIAGSSSVLYHSSLRTCRGPLTGLPYTNSNGENLKELCGAPLQANSNGAKKRGHSRGWSAAIRFSIFRVLLNRSHSPFPSGWYGVVLMPFTDGNFQVSSIMPDVNCVPLSLSTSLGMPILQNTSKRASATVAASVFFRGTASGHLVAKSTIVRMYFDLSSAQGVMGPTISTVTQDHGKWLQRCGRIPSLIRCLLAYVT